MVDNIHAAQRVNQASRLVTIWSPWWGRYLGAADFTYGSHPGRRITGLSSMIFIVDNDYVATASLMDVAITLEFALQQSARNMDVRASKMIRKHPGIDKDLVGLAQALEINSDIESKFLQLDPVRWDLLVSRNVDKEYRDVLDVRTPPRLPDGSWTSDRMDLPPNLRAENYLEMLIERNNDAESDYLDNQKPEEDESDSHDEDQEQDTPEDGQEQDTEDKEQNQNQDEDEDEDEDQNQDPNDIEQDSQGEDSEPQDQDNREDTPPEETDNSEEESSDDGLEDDEQDQSSELEQEPGTDDSSGGDSPSSDGSQEGSTSDSEGGEPSDDTNTQGDDSKPSTGDMDGDTGVPDGTPAQDPDNPQSEPTVEPGEDNNGEPGRDPQSAVGGDNPQNDTNTQGDDSKPSTGDIDGDTDDPERNEGEGIDSPDSGMDNTDPGDETSQTSQSRFEGIADKARQEANETGLHQMTIPDKPQDMELTGTDQHARDDIMNELAEDIDDFASKMPGGKKLAGDDFIEFTGKRLRKPQGSWKKALPRMLEPIVASAQMSGQSDMSFAKRNPNQQRGMPVMMGFVSYPPEITVLIDSSYSVMRDKDKLLGEFVGVMKTMFMKYAIPITVAVGDSDVRYAEQSLTPYRRVMREVSKTHKASSAEFGDSIYNIARKGVKLKGRTFPKPDIFIILTDCAFEWPWKDRSGAPSNCGNIIVISTEPYEKAKYALPPWVKDRKNFIHIGD